MITKKENTLYLPTPPSNTEKYKYFKSRLRWPFIWLLISATGVMYGYIKVAEKNYFFATSLVFLVVMIPPVIVNFWLRIQKPRLTKDIHRKIIGSYRPTSYPSVDVYLPCCGEPLHVLDNTFHYVSRVKWKGVFNVYVLDDANSDKVKELSLQYGFNYRVRPNRGELKKAGNLISAFESSAVEVNNKPGDFIAVFDADFVPQIDFLNSTIPYMNDPKVAIVQTPQYFRIEQQMNYIQRYSGVLQNLFFSYIQPARDVFKAAICAGSNVVYRRSAVELVGGFARVPIGEDVHSGVKLWAAGFETRYIPVCLATGISPEDFASISNQQTRWCRSSMLLMVDEHFIKAPFNWQQRFSFWAAFFYYMSSAALLFTGPFPTLAMMWFFPEQVYAHNYIPVLPAVFATFFVFPALANGWRPDIYRLCIINSCCHAFAIYYAIRGRVAEWVPTGAATKKDIVPLTVSRILRTWIIVVQILLWSSVILRVYEYGLRPYWAIILLGAVQFYMLFPLLRNDYGIKGSNYNFWNIFQKINVSPRVLKTAPLFLFTAFFLFVGNGIYNKFFDKQSKGEEAITKVYSEIYTPAPSIYLNSQHVESLLKDHYFNKDSKIFDKDEEVIILQKFLNTHGFSLSSSGEGSLGNETDYFGTLTYRAVIKFQREHNIPVTGVFDLETRNIVNNIIDFELSVLEGV
ncbi:MAG TPA: glycosyltransferase family 2 protein [Candidatus Paceibacterota bacterium]